jgi:hypothetical protein
MERKDTPDLLVACLCATRCKTCTEFRGTYEKLAAANPDLAR